MSKDIRGDNEPSGTGQSKKRRRVKELTEGQLHDAVMQAVVANWSHSYITEALRAAWMPVVLSHMIDHLGKYTTKASLESSDFEFAILGAIGRCSVEAVDAAQREIVRRELGAHLLLLNEQERNMLLGALAIVAKQPKTYSAMKQIISALHQHCHGHLGSSVVASVVQETLTESCNNGGT